MKNLSKLSRTNFDFHVISTIGEIPVFLKRFLHVPRGNNSKVELITFQPTSLIKEQGVNRIVNTTWSFLFIFFSGITNSSFAQQDTTNTILSDLEPLLEPDPLPFSFQTPGWYFLAGALFLFVFFIFIKWVRNYVKNAYRREALKNLSVIEAEFKKQKDILCLNDVLILLKLVAIKSYGRQTVAELYGDKWLLFLEEKGNGTPFRKYANTISAMAFNSGEIDKDELVNIIGLTKKWIKTHA